MGKVPRKRLDVLLVEKGLADSPEHAQALIMAGEIFDEKGVRLDKAGTAVPEDTALEIRSRKSAFASRGGHKLEHAFQKFSFSVEGKVCLDIGASTGGFTDCLLKHGAKHVFAVDVGYGLLDSLLRKDPRVTNLEKTNARFLKASDVTAEPSVCVMDVSFISIKQVAEPLAKNFPSLRDFIFLFKPQFEVAPKYVLKGGIVENQTVIDDALDTFSMWGHERGLDLLGGPESSPLPGKKSGNVEYLLHYGRR